MEIVTMRQLLEAGVHFGHQTRRWNPKMKKYIFTDRGGIYIIDLKKTVECIEKEYSLVAQKVEDGESILFVGTKKQAYGLVRRSIGVLRNPAILRSLLITHDRRDW